MRVSRFYLLLSFSIVRPIFSGAHPKQTVRRFAETFEGLGIGSRLAYLELPDRYFWVRVAGAILYGVTTPIGIAAGLGVRTTYNQAATTASIVSGIMDSLSAGILIYTGLVEVCNSNSRLSSAHLNR